MLLWQPSAKGICVHVFAVGSPDKEDRFKEDCRSRVISADVYNK